MKIKSETLSLIRRPWRVGFMLLLFILVAQENSVCGEKLVSWNFEAESLTPDFVVDGMDASDLSTGGRDDGIFRFGDRWGKSEDLGDGDEHHAFAVPPARVKIVRPTEARITYLSTWAFNHVGEKLSDAFGPWQPATYEVTLERLKEEGPDSLLWFGFEIGASGKNSLSLDSISIDMSKGAAGGIAPQGGVIVFSLDGFATFEPLGYVHDESRRTVDSNWSRFIFDVSGVTQLQKLPVGQMVEIRIYPYTRWGETGSDVRWANPSVFGSISKVQ